MKFRIINWAAQIEAWRDFTQLNPEQHPNTASLSEAFSNLGKTFAKQGVSLTWDDMLGLIIQSNLKDQMRQSVDQKGLCQLLKLEAVFLIATSQIVKI
ncbi:hypothetical protein PCASD_01174 [Puccinia coronata f. sp. avenae]|uniref:Uncharacterized protein n=1 Tax=Puccinia coronata f. sp. avenae TaxID=200324 RepID=A0A2N5TES2_9BASI|nr:hypothetical protein PCASD_11021 [Puccinia coronata f. sp. avenae]PLW50833.1 hypothetical protein PCASD_01174 [Puccinia coronata f. sp. avenae]